MVLFRRRDSFEGILDEIEGRVKSPKKAKPITTFYPGQVIPLEDRDFVERLIANTGTFLWWHGVKRRRSDGQLASIGWDLGDNNYADIDDLGHY